MNFEIISIGTELLLGQIVNTNARDISRLLSELGMNVYYTTVVGDNPSRLTEALEVASNRADGIITTGGLGPTKDDLTKETIAKFFGLKCVTHDESLKRLTSIFEKQYKYMAKSNLKQADMPEGCIVLKNDFGTALGAIIENEKATVIMLPGPPSEMKPMLYNEVRPYLEKLADGVIYSKVLHVFGLGESEAEERIADLIESAKNPTVAPYAKTGETEFRLTAKAGSKNEAQELLAPLEDKVRAAFGDYIYAEGEDATMHETVVKLLLKHKKTITFAESCTGGLLAKKITEVSGASECFNCSYVTYSNEQKEKILGVSHKTLKKHGAVSEHTALEMCRGAKDVSDADIAVSVTGIAGPGGGTADKPVGLVYIGICTDDICEVKRILLSGSREAIRERTSLRALDMVRRTLINL